MSSLRENWVVSVGLLAVAALVIAVDPAKLGRDLANADRLVVLVMLPTVLRPIAADARRGSLQPPIPSRRPGG